jgi:hypothetical protein
MMFSTFLRSFNNTFKRLPLSQFNPVHSQWPWIFKTHFVTVREPGELKSLGFESGWGDGVFPFPKTCTPALMPIQSLIRWVACVKRPEPEADHSSLSSVEVKKEFSCASAPSNMPSLCGQENLTFYHCLFFTVVFSSASFSCYLLLLLSSSSSSSVRVCAYILNSWILSLRNINPLKTNRICLI